MYIHLKETVSGKIYVRDYYAHIHLHHLVYFKYCKFLFYLHNNQ